jgi:AhpD family alkylhydroperoxidase
MTPSPSGAAWTYDGFRAAAPAVVQALAALSKAVDNTGLDKGLTELVKVRVSQINGCVFCFKLHLDASRRVGTEGAKLDLVATRRDAGAFSEREMAALIWSEALTGMLNHPIAESAYRELHRHFSEIEAIHLTAAITNISAWNRIAGGLRFAPPVASNA